jgi:hypothetical protein
MPNRACVTAHWQVLPGLVLLLAGCASGGRVQVDRQEELPASYPKPSPLDDPRNWQKRNQEVAAWLEPPPADQPQPKYVCDDPNSPIPTVWKGQTATFSWVVRNGGQAPLRLHSAT